MSRDSNLYALLNTAGAGALAWYGVLKDAPIFVALETVWALTAATTLVLRTIRWPR